MVSIPACHAGDRGSIPRRGDSLVFGILFYFILISLVLTLKFDMKGAFDRSFPMIRLYLKFVFQISSNVIF